MDDEEKRRRKNMLAKRRLYNKLQGRPNRALPHEFAEVRAIIRDYHSRGMPFKAMAEQTGLHPDSFAKVARERDNTITVSRKTYEGMRGLYFEPPPPGRTDDGLLGAKVDPTPSIRRIAAMIADGYPQYWLAKEQLGTNTKVISRMMTGSRSFIFSTSEAKIKELYRKLDGVDPLDMGVTPQQKRYAQLYAQRVRHPGRMCWDEDTIDDLAAFPEWTGACGTVGGYYLHLRHGIHVEVIDKPSGARQKVLCKPCIDARAEVEGTRAAGDAAAASRVDVDDAVAEGLQQGRTHRDIAKSLGVSTRTIQRVSNRLKETGWEPNKKGPGRLKKEES